MGARFGRYELVELLGSGGMAEVFLARYVGPEGFEKRLVIKRVLPQFSDDQRLLRMFFEEARTHVSLSHGNLVSVFDFGRVENEYFIAMEYVHGADLARLIRSADGAPPAPGGGAGLPAPLVAYVGMEVCRGLAYVHRRGFVHRDISPRNVLLSVDGEVKLSDFGLVMGAEDANASSVRGTLAYIAPEQARAERVDGRADLYSLGVVLAEATLGRSVRNASNDAHALLLARDAEPVRIDGPLAAVIERATEVRPDKRFGSADEMLDALEKVIGALGAGRERTVHDLATRVQALAATRLALPDSPTGLPRTRGTQAVADATAIGRRPLQRAAADSYYRDSESASFVDEVLRAPSVRPRPRRWPLVALAALLLAVGTPVVVYALRARSAPLAKVAASASSPPPVAPVPPVVPDRADPTPTVPDPVPEAAPGAAAAASARRHAGTEHAHAAGAPGTLQIQCTPWCVPYVDGAARGVDRRNHALTLSAGRHDIEVRRLDDRQRRAVDIRPGQTRVEAFQFR